MSQIYQHQIANSYKLKHNCDVTHYSEYIKMSNFADPEMLTKSYVEELERSA